MFSVVVMFLRLNPRIRQMIDLDRQAQLFSRLFHHLSNFQYGKLLGKLIEYTAFTTVGRVQACNLNATHRISNVQETAGLAALTVDGERVSYRCLHAEAVQHRSKYFIVIKTVDERVIQGRFVGNRSIDNSLIQIDG